MTVISAEFGVQTIIVFRSFIVHKFQRQKNRWCYPAVLEADQLKHLVITNGCRHR